LVFGGVDFTLDPGTKVRMTCDVKIPTQIATYLPVTLFSTFPHMHLLGTRSKLELIPKIGTPKTLVEVKPWDFNHQISYAATATLKTGEETVADMNYGRHGQSYLYTNRDPLRYEKQMLDGWLRSHFRPGAIIAWLAGCERKREPARTRRKGMFVMIIGEAVIDKLTTAPGNGAALGGLAYQVVREESAPR